MPNNPAKSYFKFKTQRVIAIASLLIFIGKITAYLITSSVGILTDALESTVNVATGFISLYAVYISLKPKDSNHPFGHGKAEFLQLGNGGGGAGNAGFASEGFFGDAYVHRLVLLYG